MSPSPRPLRLTGTVLAALLLAGCGSSSPSSGDQTAAESPSSAAPSPEESPSEDHSGHAESASPSEPGAESETPEAAPVTITIAEFAYQVSGKVAPGTRVKVTNEDTEAHTVTARNGTFDVTVAPGATATFKAPAKAGSYAFYCIFHTGMEDELTVR